MADRKERSGKFEKVKRPFNVRGVSGDTYLATGGEDKQLIIKQITKTFTGQSFAIVVEALTPREAKEKVAAYRTIAEEDLRLKLQGEPYVDPTTGQIRQPATGKIEKQATARTNIASPGRKPGKYAVLLANAKLRPGFMTVAAGDAGLTPAEIRDKIISNATHEHGSGDAVSTSDYRALSQEFGTVVHQMLQKEYLRGEALQIERKFYNPEGSVRGSADIIARGSRIVEIKSVTGGIFQALAAKQEPYPTHVVQLNTYLASLGKSTGQIVYVNRENLAQRLTFEFKFNPELWERTKANIQKAQAMALRVALKKGISLEKFYSSEVYGPSEALPSDEELRRQYGSMLFKSLTTRRGMPDDLEKLKKTRSQRGSRSEGLLHGWFGRTRRERTDFGSGFQAWDDYDIYNIAEDGSFIEGAPQRPSRTTARRFIHLDDRPAPPPRPGVRVAGKAKTNQPPHPPPPPPPPQGPKPPLAGAGPSKQANQPLVPKMAPRGLYEFVKDIEERSPWQILKTFRISEKMQPWVLASRNETIKIAFDELVKSHPSHVARAELYISSGQAVPDEVLTPKGKLWKRALGGKLPVDMTTRQMVLDPYKGSMFRVRGTTHAVEIAQMDTRAIMQKAMREGVVGEPSLEKLEKAAAKAWERGDGLPFKLGKVLGKGGVYEDSRIGKKLFQHMAQRELRGFKKVEGFAPLHSIDLAQTPFRRGLSLAQQKASATAFGGYLRINRLLNEVGLGLRTGTFDRVLTLPFHNTLAQTGLGKALKLTPNLKGGIVNKLLTRRFLPAAAILGGLRYLDYKTGHAVSNLPVHAYVTTKKALANISDTLGFPKKYREMMEKVSPFPLYGPTMAFSALGFFAGAGSAAHVAKGGAGAIEASLTKLGLGGEFKYFEKFAAPATGSITARGFSPAYQALRGKMAAKGAKIGLLASLPWLIAQLIPGKSAEEYAQIYSGQKEVPIKKGRWWESSSTPYQGDKTQEYRKHWIARFLNRDRIKEEYGSEQEYWRRSLATPIGWVNLLLDPYGKERVAAKRGRRFPLTEELFTDVPFIGKNIGRWVGHTIKPQRFMYGTSLRDFADMYQSENPELEPSYDLGGLKPQKPTLASSFRNVISDTVDEALTQIGLPGWLTKLGLRATTGSQRPLQSKEPRLQTADSVGSKERWFYGLDLGGGFFTTETVRRFIQNTPRDIQTYNPLTNENIPSWLSSENELRKYHFGDVLDKAPAGAGMWIPGPEYNERMGLPAGLSPEDYPDMHKLAILAHLQPYSKRIPKLVTKLQGQDLTPEQSYFVAEMRKQTQDVRTSEVFQDRIFTGKIKSYTGTVSDSAGEFFRLSERPYKQFKLAGLSFELNDIANQLMHEGMGRELAISRARNLQEDARNEAQPYLKKGANVQFYAEEGAPEGLEKPSAVVMRGNTNVNSLLASTYHLPIIKDGPASQLLYSGTERAVGKLAESISHDSPLPFINKFMGANDPLEKYKREQVYGRKIKLWDKPIEHFFKTGYWNIRRRIGPNFNSFSAKDDTFNTIEGLQGSIHKQFGIFGSGLLFSAGRSIRNLVREYAGEVKKLGKFWKNETILGTTRRGLGRPRPASITINVGSTLTAQTPAAIRDWAGLASNASYTSFMSKLPKVQRAAYFRGAHHIRRGFLGSKFKLNRLPLFNFRGMGEGTSRHVGGMFQSKGWKILRDANKKIVLNPLGMPVGQSEEVGLHVAGLLRNVPHEPMWANYKRIQGILGKDIRASRAEMHVFKDLANIAGKQSRQHAAFVTRMGRGGPLNAARVKKVAAYYGNMSEEVVGNMMEVLSSGQKQMREGLINEDAFMRLRGWYQKNPQQFKAHYGGKLRQQFMTEAAHLEGGYFSEEFYTNVVGNSTLYKEMATPATRQIVRSKPGASLGEIAAVRQENDITWAEAAWRKSHGAAVAQLSHPIENINNIAAAHMQAGIKSTPLLETAMAEREAGYARYQEALRADVPVPSKPASAPTAAVDPGGEVPPYLRSADAGNKTGGQGFFQQQQAQAEAQARASAQAAPPLVDPSAPIKDIQSKSGGTGFNSFSAKDDAALKEEGLRHGWFGKTRKDRTSFGSGFVVGALDDVAFAAYRGYKTRLQAHKYAQLAEQEDQTQQETFQYLRALHAEKSMEYVKHIGHGQGLHPGGDGFSTALIREKTDFGSGFMSPDRDKPVPKYTSKARQIQEYFDKLSYMKYRKLRDSAEEGGDVKKAKYFSSKMGATMLGVNPIASEPEQVTSLLPKAERPYFSAFVNEADPSRRAEIIQTVPKYEQRLLMGQWFRQTVDSSALVESAQQTAAFLAYAQNQGYANAASEGGGAEAAREAELQQFFDETGLSVPDDDWIGWDERVDNKDIMMMYLQKSGEDIHDYDLWEDRQSMLRRKPYLAGAVDPLINSGSHLNTSTNVRKVFSSLGVGNAQATRFENGNNEINLTIKIDPDTIVQRSGLKDELVQTLPKTRREGWDPVDFYASNPAASPHKGVLDHQRRSVSEERKRTELGVW